MQEAQMTAPIGTQLQGRYVIEDLLGQGGFSAVYIVKDRKLGGKRFAIKELKNQSKSERERFLFECEILKRLQHPALPVVSHLFEDNSQTYMLMEYIDGSNLEKLRKQQVEERFSLSEVLTLLTPVVDAVNYLHRQPIPVLHRDIKPANIVLKDHGKTVLVDFGIAKEYHPDTTTTAIRHCSAGYSAPEQYSGVGTDTRSDVYSLGATSYTLLTGTVPLDALQRTTTFVTRGKDPLRALNELVPALSIQVTRVIERAMAISAERRYATVTEFWQALNAAALLPPTQEPVKDQTIVPEQTSNRESGVHEPLRVASGRGRWRIIIPIIVLAALLLGGGVPLTTFLISKHTTSTTNTTSTKTVQRVGSKATSTVAPVILPELVQQYKGTIYNLLTKNTTEMTLTQVQQSGQVLNGAFTGLGRTSAFSGVRDTSKHLFFTIAPSNGQESLFFQGAVRGDGNLVGNYCRQDTSGQCIGDYGIWSVGPILK
ncbi:MAG: serine/threonine protein kinase [Ktedonobacteraceae bacterium]|nr:serine/threonine protein kinase [Ktedonobacteraceae bacterium]